MFGYLVENLPEHLTCYGEDGTTDLTVYDVVEDDERVKVGAWQQGRIASLEIKLVYRTYNETRGRDYAATLCHQVEANSRRGGAMSVGFIFGVFALWPPKTPRRRGEFLEFRREISGIVRDVCEAENVPCAKPGAGDRDRATLGDGRRGDGTVRSGRHVLPRTSHVEK